MAGSVVGHGISNMLFGGRSAEQAPPPAEYANQAREVTGNCDIPAKGTFASCAYDGSWRDSTKKGGKLMVQISQNA